MGCSEMPLIFCHIKIKGAIHKRKLGAWIVIEINYLCLVRSEKK